MYKILEKSCLAQDIYQMRIEAPRVAASALPGQFVIVRADEQGERIPLTIADYNAAEGWVTLVIQAIGVSTRKIVALNAGDYLTDFAGPLGHCSEFVNEDFESEVKPRRYLFIAGGVGSAPIYPQVKWLHSRGVTVEVILGAKSREMLTFAKELEAVCDELHICTDDGSAGFKGLVTQRYNELVAEGRKYDLCISIGPMIMMKFVAMATKANNLKTIVSLNTLMVDGTGMCGACRVTVGGKTRFTCVEGPEFDGHEVDYDEALRRMTMYKDQEQRALAIAKKREEGHKCRIGLDK